MSKTQRHPRIGFRSLLVIVLCIAAIESVSAQIVGRWRSVETSRDGIGVMYEFHPDGVVDYSPGAIVDLSWRTEANELVLPSGAVNGPERRQAIRWINPNQLQFIDHGVPTLDLARVGDTRNAENLLLGEWTGIQDMDGRKLEMHWFFYPAGKGLFLLPFLTTHGQYTINGSTLTVLMQGKSASSLRFEVKDHILNVANADGIEKSRFASY